MAPNTPYFDLLDDGLVQQTIQQIPTNRGAYCWHNLASTCRRMCTLVRRSRCVRIFATPQDIQHLVKAPSHRAFCNVHVLHLNLGEPFELEAWAQFVEAAAGAAAAWPQLEEAHFEGILAGREGCRLGSLSGAVLPLRRISTLRRLHMEVLSTSDLAYMPLLTQLTHLALFGPEQGLSIYGAAATWPLAAMANLVSLQLQGFEPESAWTCVLPPNVTCLELRCHSIQPQNWLKHVFQCQQLRKLHMDSEIHPLEVLHIIAKHTPQLATLRVTCWDEPGGTTEGTTEGGTTEGDLDRMVFCMLSPEAIEDGEQEREWQVVPPLGRAQGIAWPYDYVVVPPPNMGGLPALQHLQMDGWWLVLSSERYWRALAACHHLQTLPELHVSVPPPAGVTFPGVTRLQVTTSTSPGDTLALLGAFPALKELEMRVVPNDAGATEPQAWQPQVVLGQVTSASVAFFQPPDLPPDAHAACLAAYCTALWSALPGLQKLALEWPNIVQLLPVLPAASALQQLRSLQLDSSYARAAITCGGAAVVGPQQVVAYVQGAAQLQALTVNVELAPGSSKDQLVLGLQGALPGLRRLVALKRGERLAPATLAALRPGLAVR